MAVRVGYLAKPGTIARWIVMRKLIAGIQVSLDGFVEGPKAEIDWAAAEDEESWSHVFELLAHTDALLLGRVTIPTTPT